MFLRTSIVDTRIPEKTLCLTYDDGPGPDSAAIGAFLAERKVRATFFVVGKFAAERPEVLDQWHAQGHIIGNHTYEHPDLPFYVSIGGDVRDQVARTNSLIRKYNEDRPTYFRATYGKWSPEVANELNVDLRTSFQHVGPVYWNIDGIDCHYWKLGRSVEETVDAYVEDIVAKGKGIIVMHDGIADMETVATKNRTLELTRALIPKLQDMGYTFVGLDEIDDPELRAPLSDSFALQAPNGKFLARATADGSTLTCSGTSASDPGTQFVIKQKSSGKVALQTVSGQYLQVDADRDEHVRLGATCDLFSLFDVIPVSDGRIMFRSHNGNYLAVDTAAGALLKASAPFMRQAGCFLYVPKTGAYVKPVSLAQKMERVKRRLRFVKSKLLQS